MNIQPQPRAIPPAAAGWAPLALGFRPFFLLAGLAAVSLIGLWPLVWRGRLTLPTYFDPIAWHAHEMLFGYAAAVVAGFLLTAVRNWTGIPTWTGGRLAALAVVWLAARLLPWVPGVPSRLLVAVDVAFLPLVALSLAYPLWRGQNRVNRVFLLLLGGMALANLLSHLQLLGIVTSVGDARRLMLVLIVLLIVVVAGRVLPFFTQNVLPGFRPGRRPWVERLTLALPPLILAAEALPSLHPAVPGVLWCAFAGALAMRLGGWFDARVFRIPVLWVLHVGYAWLALGALLTGLAYLGLFPRASALHALTAGGIGVFTIGMMARVARGHTGRPVDVPRTVMLAFIAVNLAALARVFGTAGLPGAYPLWVDLSATSWSFGFALFAWHYLPMLLRTRADGKPG